jgi:hypothetical protein
MSGKILLARSRSTWPAGGACLDTFRATGRTGGYRINVDLAPAGSTATRPASNRSPPT